ncbi:MULTISPECIES: GNAT family N-acetyltransferase [unclassified Flavobacterium]|uniref:GNAT family N-acetyltransferase n=1 Tax=unclassified Flavobacterium TaxID=196869 RepID=UPI001F12C984|nr:MULTISPECIES: GNAT family N-acetyltransferase [unclassified Flavobacterium]UMY65096.1 GNAT family N-acetyltransferase [Flavobacterium sp. HJ-32-4]
MTIVDYQPAYRADFERLNRAWITRFFEMEPEDYAVLSDPEVYILEKGGQIFFAEHEGTIIGTVALLPVGDGEFKLLKMAVDDRFQGMGVGKQLCAAALDEVRRRGGTRVVLFTNSTLAAALHVYRHFGFREVPAVGSVYKRADTKMEVIL